jgi:hypothetical protein
LITVPPEEWSPETEPIPPEPKMMEPATCPPGKHLAAEGHCCRPSENWDGKHCTCPEGEIWTDRFCAPPVEPEPDEPWERDCPYGKRWDSIERTCISIERPHKTESATCSSGQSWDGRRCVCEEGMRWDRGSRRCVPHKAEPGLHPCPPGMHRPRSIGSCVCMPGHHRAGNQCIKCPRGHEWKDGRCIPPKAMQPKLQHCPSGMHRRGERGACVCMPGHHRAGNQCIKCPRGHEWKEGRCIPPKPKTKQPQWQRCPPGMHHKGGRGACVCMPGHNQAGNQCIKCPPKHKWVPQRQKCERIVE